MAIDEVKKYITERKKFFAAITAGVLLVILLLIAPIATAKSYATRQFSNALPGDSFVKSSQLFSPTVVVFTQEVDGDVSANFVVLSRKYLVGWRVASITSQEVDNKYGDRTTEDIVADLTNEIKNGNLTSGDSVDVDSISEADRRIKVLSDKEYQVIVSFTDEAGNTLKLEATDDGGTVLTRNDKQLPISGNVSSPAISPDGDKVCYSKYSKEAPSEDGHAESEYSGTVYCLNLASGQEAEVYTFGEDMLLSIAVNKTYLVYSLSSGEIGVINLENKQKTVLLNMQMLPESDPGFVIFIDEQSAIIDPNDYEKLVNNNQGMINIDLTVLAHVRE